MIQVERLSKAAPRGLRLDDVSFSVEPGSICGLMGRNGAGKSTMLQCIVGLLRPDKGAVRVAGGPVTAKTFEQLAFVPEEPAFYSWLTVHEHMRIAELSYARFDAGLSRSLCDRFELDPAQKIGVMSRGQLTSLALVMAFAIRPTALILDQPTSNLDPYLKQVVLELIIDAASNGATVLFSSHQVGQIERSADRLVALREGVKVLDAEVEYLRANERVIEARVDELGIDLAAIAAYPNVRRVQSVGAQTRIFVSSGWEPLAQVLLDNGAETLRTYERGLEEVFLDVIDAASPAVRRDRE